MSDKRASHDTSPGGAPLHDAYTVAEAAFTQVQRGERPMALANLAWLMKFLEKHDCGQTVADEEEKR